MKAFLSLGSWGWVLNAISSRAKSLLQDNESHKTRVKNPFSRLFLSCEIGVEFKMGL